MGRFERPTNKLEVYYSIQLSYIINVSFYRIELKATPSADTKYVGKGIDTALPPYKSNIGGSGVRTHDLHLAKMPLYQLSYTPFPDYTINFAYPENRRCAV